MNKNGITKEEILKLLDDKSILHAHASILQEKYYASIKNLLHSFSNDTKIDKLSILDELPDDTTYEESLQGRFAQFVKNKTTNEVEAWLQDLYTSLKTWVDIVVVAKRDEWNHTVHQKNHKIHIILAVLISITLPLVICAFLEVFGVLSLPIGAICGILDFAFGVSFFIYELVNDHQKEKQYAKLVTHEDNESSGVKISIVKTVNEQSHGNLTNIKAKKIVNHTEVNTRK